MFPRPLATNIFFQYTVTGDLSCMECMIYDPLFVFVLLSVSMYVTLILSGGSRKTVHNLNVVMLLPPFPQVYQYMLLCICIIYVQIVELGIKYLVSCIYGDPPPLFFVFSFLSYPLITSDIYFVPPFVRCVSVIPDIWVPSVYSIFSMLFNLLFIPLVFMVSIFRLFIFLVLFFLLPLWVGFPTFRYDIFMIRYIYSTKSIYNVYIQTKQIDMKI